MPTFSVSTDIVLICITLLFYIVFLFFLIKIFLKILEPQKTSQENKILPGSLAYTLLEISEKADAEKRKKTQQEKLNEETKKKEEETKKKLEREGRIKELQEWFSKPTVEEEIKYLLRKCANSGERCANITDFINDSLDGKFNSSYFLGMPKSSYTWLPREEEMSVIQTVLQHIFAKEGLEVSIETYYISGTYMGESGNGTPRTETFREERLGLFVSW